MEIIIDGVYVNRDNCTATPFKFGKEVDDILNVLKHKYTMNCEVNFLKEKFEKIFNNFVEDYKEDDEQYPGQEDHLLLRKKGYPTLQSLLDEDVEFLARFIIDNLGLELMDCILGGRNSKLEYVICNIEDIIIEKYNVSIVGYCINYQRDTK